MNNRQTIQTKQLIGRQINRHSKSLTKNDKRTQTQNGRQNVQKLRQQLTARFRYAGNLLHSKISVRFKL